MSEGVAAFFEPKSVAVVGASRNPEKLGHVVLRQLLENFEGRVYPVNPKADEILGLKCYPSVTSLPEAVDLAVVAVPAPITPQVVRECGERGVKAAIVISGGFSEVGNVELEEELKETAKKYGVRIIGPNCMGIYRPSSGLDTLFTPSDRLPRPPRGDVAILTQSGSFGGAILTWLAMEGKGISVFVSYGNRADVDEADLIEYLSEDPETRVIAIYIEGLSNGRRFMEAARRVSPRKPIVVFKAGRSQKGARAVQSHTGSLAGSDSAYEAAFKQSGVVRAYSTEEFLDVSRALARLPLPRGPGVGIITNGGGYGVIAVDALEEQGLEVPDLDEDTRKRLREQLPPYYPVGNPLDLTGSSTPEQYLIGMREMAKSESIDALMVMALYSVPLMEPKRTTDYILQVVEQYGKPVVVVSLDVTPDVAEQNSRLESLGIPVYPAPERAAKALAALWRYARAKARLATASATQ
ncbi:MAG TPA: CoA-binding protein [Candidatus Korarchaeota archaeon]|nr:CoA-binding protein [Candidatus Korarchaeota archaeon]